MSDVRKPHRDRVGVELAIAEMRMVAGRLHAMADEAEAGRNAVHVDVPGFRALADYVDKWARCVDQTCEARFDTVCDDLSCPRCGSKWPDRCQTYDGASGWHDFRYCPHCGARVVSGDE